MGLAQAGVQPRVVGQCANALAHQQLGHLLHPLARLAVNNACLVGVFALDEAQELPGGVGLFDDGVADVGPVKAADELARAVQLQVLDHVGTRQVVRRGGERHAGHAGVTLVQHAQGAVVGPEVMAPLAHAVCFVNGKQAQQPALVQRVQLGQKTRCGDALGRGV